MIQKVPQRTAKRFLRLELQACPNQALLREISHSAGVCIKIFSRGFTCIPIGPTGILQYARGVGKMRLFEALAIRSFCIFPHSLLINWRSAKDPVDSPIRGKLASSRVVSWLALGEVSDRTSKLVTWLGVEEVSGGHFVFGKSGRV